MSDSFKKNKILFMGTPDFASTALAALISNNYNVVGVVTQTDKPKGRSFILTPSPVKVYALTQGLHIFQPTTLKGEDFAELLDSIAPDLIVVAAYGKILPQNVIDYPKYGCINIHGSLLPYYRGAAPIQRAIINGEKFTGITTMFMDTGIDTGDILEQSVTEITDDENFETLHDKLAVSGALTLISTLEKIYNGSLKRIKQDDTASTYAAKIENADCVINFNRSAFDIFNQIRGLSPIPLAFTKLNGKMLKIVSAKIIDISDSAPVGTVTALNSGMITVACGDKAIGITSLIPEGKKLMSAVDFINGRKVVLGNVLY